MKHVNVKENILEICKKQKIFIKILLSCNVKAF